MTNNSLEDEPTSSPIGKAWFWFSQIVSIVGLVSIIEDLRTWARVISGLVDSLFAPLGVLLTFLYGILHFLVEIFRTVFRPVMDWLLQWLPFELPDLAKDMAVVAVFVASGLLRTKIRSHLEYRQAQKMDDAELLERARSFGLGEANASKLRSALSHYRMMRMHERDGKLAKPWEWDVQRFGTAIQLFAEDEYKRVSARHMHKVFMAEDRAVRIVWVCAGITILLVIVDVVAR